MVGRWFNNDRAAAITGTRGEASEEAMHSRVFVRVNHCLRQLMGITRGGEEACGQETVSLSLSPPFLPFRLLVRHKPD